LLARSCPQLDEAAKALHTMRVFVAAVAFMSRLERLLFKQRCSASKNITSEIRFMDHKLHDTITLLGLTAPHLCEGVARFGAILCIVLNHFIWRKPPPRNEH
jgi:hypothetical protein